MTHPRYEGLDWLRIWSSFGIVFLHVFVAAGYPNSLWLFLKFRDFALPVMVMSSVFLLTVSLTRQPATDFKKFFRRRVQRLWLPFFVWTIFYSLSETFLLPIFFGAETFGELPAPITLLTGYRHLWFLQFIFVGSMLVYWLINGLFSESVNRQSKLSVFCFFASLIYAILFWAFLKNHTDWDNLNPQLDISLRIFVSQTSSYLFYIPVAVGIGLISGKIRDLHERVAVRRFVCVVAAITMLVYLAADGILWMREIYGIAVFLVALQPWGKISSKLWRTLAAYSYGIYILHFLPVQILWLFVNAKNLELNGTAVIGLTLIVYSVSLAFAVLLRKLFPANWLLPLVPISSVHSQPSEPDKFSFVAPRASDSSPIHLSESLR